MNPSQPAGPSVHPLLAQLLTRHGFTEVNAANFDAFTAQAGQVLLVFTEDPVRYRESLDLAVIVPEIARAFPGQFAVGVLFPEAARALHQRFGIRRWPAYVLLRDGHYVGAVEGLRNWDEYLNETAALLAAPARRPPTIGIAVKGPNEAPDGCQH